MLIRNVASGLDSWFVAACVKPVITATTSDRIKIFLTLFMVVFLYFWLRHKICDFFLKVSIGRKSYIPFGKSSSILAANGWKAKIYEITKLHISWHDRHRRSRITLVGLQRICAAGAVAGHDYHDFRHGTDCEAAA